MDPAIASPGPDRAPGRPSGHPVPPGHGPDHGPAGHAGRGLRASRLAGLAAAAGVVAYVGLVDPSRGGAYPVCPSRVILGLDCPGCGGLRGTHDLLNGDVVGALDHNLLLPVLLAAFGVAFALWLRPLVGRAPRPLRLHRWWVVAGVVVALGFTVLRNLPVAGLEFLAAGG